ncbi:TIGR04255 family protein [Pseudomonas sp. KB_15]|uniref:TIGR04255 family protein n=1 Tax=Pseudomonas sp. KB_15 TaxID=3233035 RepID=UPI003F94C73C
MSDRSGILQNSPLVYALASIRFAPWPLLAERFPQIQDAFRDIAPLINEIQVQVPAPGLSMAPEFTTSKMWMMLSADRSLGIQLSADQVFIFSREYTSYTEFEKVLERVLTELLRQMRFIDVNAMGVRFIDHIKTSTQDELQKYVSAQLLAPAFEGFEQLGGSSMTSYRCGEGKELRVRYTNFPGQPSMSEDLMGLLIMTQDPTIGVNFDTLKPGEAVIDMDAIQQMSRPLRVDAAPKALEHLRALHSVANDFFRHKDVFTDYAFSSWKGENVK